MAIDTAQLEAIFLDCLYANEEDAYKYGIIVAQGVVRNFGFDPKKIKLHHDEILALLNELPKEFHDGADGGGWTFLNAVSIATAIYGVNTNKLKNCFA